MPRASAFTRASRCRWAATRPTKRCARGGSTPGAARPLATLRRDGGLRHARLGRAAPAPSSRFRSRRAPLARELGHEVREDVLLAREVLGGGRSGGVALLPQLADILEIRVLA